MFRGFFLGLCLVIAFGLNAQSLDTLISHFNRSIAKYESVYPFQEPIPLDSIGLSPEEAAEFFPDYSAMDEVYPPELQGVYLSKLDNTVAALFEHPD